MNLAIICWILSAVYGPISIISIAREQRSNTIQELQKNAKQRDMVLLQEGFSDFQSPPESTVDCPKVFTLQMATYFLLTFSYFPDPESGDFFQYNPKSTLEKRFAVLKEKQHLFKTPIPLSLNCFVKNPQLVFDTFTGILQEISDIPPESLSNFPFKYELRKTSEFVWNARADENFPSIKRRNMNCNILWDTVTQMRGISIARKIIWFVEKDGNKSRNIVVVVDEKHANIVKNTLKVYGHLGKVCNGNEDKLTECSCCWSR